MDSLIIGQFADLRAYLVNEIMSRCKQLYDQPETSQDIADLLENFPETLQLLKTSGQEEAKITNTMPPICYEQRIDRLISIICVLQSHIENNVLATTEVPHILSEMCAHIGRLTIDRREQSDYLEMMEDYAVHISDSYWAPREDGREPAITYDHSQAEAFSIWNRLNGPIFGCDCRQCSAPSVDQADM